MTSHDRPAEGLERFVELAGGSGDVGNLQGPIARTGQRTNEIVKVLTLTSVTLLPATAVAGIMGMNFKVGLFSHPGYFWVVLGSVAVIAAGILVVAKLRAWL